MSFHEVPPFDSLTDQAAPHEGFGDILSCRDITERKFIEGVAEAANRISEVFDVRIGTRLGNVRELDRLIDDMWFEGWTPNDDAINVFATDFGSVLTHLIREAFGGELVFRSDSDLSHLSCWWESERIEVFPFHKTYKRLSSREGESLVFFVSRVKQLLHR